MRTEPYRVGAIAGHGLLALLHPRLDTVAFCDTSAKKRQDAVTVATAIKQAMRSVKEPTPCRPYADYREMIETERPEIVTIAAPDPCHAEMSVFALEHGAHVFVEKPMCVTLEDCARMVDAVRRTGLKLAVNQCARTIQAIQAVFDKRDRGELGMPYYVRAEYLHGGLRDTLYADPDSWRANERTTLGGSSHAIDLVLGLMRDPPESVFAVGAQHMFGPRGPHADLDAVLMRFPGGRMGYAVTSLGCHRRGLGLAFELYGTKQDVIQTVTHLDGDDEDRNRQAGLRFYDAGGGRSLTTFSRTQTAIDIGHGEGFYRQLENLLYAIEHDVKQRTMADVVDGARTVATALAADESARSGRAAPVQPWAPLTYGGTAPLWELDEYQRDLLREFVPLVSRESRRRILGDSASPATGER